MQSNLVFLCGPHGSGKTTFGEELKKENSDIIIPELKTRTPKFHTSPKYRLALKICQRSIENFEYLEIAEKNTDKIVLGNRCIYDQFAYNLAYYLKGWLSKEEFDKYNQISTISFVQELQEPYAIVLNPGIEAVKRHLKKRWQEKGKKWREEDFGYLESACRAFGMLKDRENIFYIDHEVDLESRAEVRETNQWLEKIMGREIIKV